MKRLILLAFALLAIFPANAAEPTGGVFGMARYIPADTDGFFAVRTDDDFLDSVDTLLNSSRAMLSDVGLVLPVEASIRRELVDIFGAASEEEVDEILAWSGEYIAVSVVQPTLNVNPSVTAIVPLVDRAAAEAYVTAMFSAGVSTPSTMGRFTVYQPSEAGYTLFADDLLLVISDTSREAVEALAAENFPTLGDLDTYIEAVEALPVAGYDIGAYLSQRAFNGTEVQESTAGMSFAFGATLLDGATLTLDIAAVAQTPFAQPLTLNPDYAAFIPQNMGAGVHGADLAALLNNVFDIVEATTGDPVRATVTEAFASLGLSIDSFFSWIKGDFAVFARLDVRSILPSLLGTPPILRGLPAVVDVALMIEAVNPAAAQEFVTSITTLIRNVQPSLTGITISEEIIRGVPILIMSAESNEGGGGTLIFDLAMGVSGEVFAIGTANAVRAVFRGGASVIEEAGYTSASAYWLPDATTHWLLDGETALNLAAMGYIFSGQMVARPSAEEFSAIIDRVGAFVRYATISSAVTDNGVALLRGTITFGE